MVKSNTNAVRMSKVEELKVNMACCPWF